MATDTSSMASDRSVTTMDTVQVRCGDIPEGGLASGTEALQSWRNVEDLTSANPADTPTNQKKRKYLPLVDDGRAIGTFYAIILALLGVAFPVKEALQNSWLSSAVVGIYLVYLYVVSLVGIVCLEVYLNRLHARERTGQQTTDAGVDSNPEHKLGFSNLGFKTDFSLSPNGRTNTLSHQASYTSESDLRIRESDQGDEEHSPHRTSIYTRIGAVIFGLGFLVYDGLLLKQIHDKQLLVTRDGISSYFWVHYIHIVFHLAQTYFIFKHPQVRVETLRPLAKIGFMHVIATNWCVWVRAVVRETFEAILVDRQGSKEGHVAGNSTDPTSDNNLYSATPYLFPFVVQYSLVALIALYSMYSDLDWRPQLSRVMTASRAPWTEINFHRTHRGIFSGMLILSGSCVSIILFFSYLNDEDNDLPRRLYYTTGIVMLGLLGSAITTAWSKIRVLGFRRPEHFPLNVLILIVALIATLLFNLFRLMAVADQLYTGSAPRRSTALLLLFDCLLSMIQPVVQCGFIVDGLCRYTATNAELNSKPGRGCMTFLLCGNVALWIFRTVQMKEINTEGAVGTGVYGTSAWQLIVHVLLPLLVYFHFHSAVCLASIWYSAYQLPRRNSVAVTSVLRQHSTVAQPSIARTSFTEDEDIMFSRSPSDRPHSPVDSGLSQPGSDPPTTVYSGSSLSRRNKRLSGGSGIYDADVEGMPVSDV